MKFTWGGRVGLEEIKISNTRFFVKPVTRTGQEPVKNLILEFANAFSFSKRFANSRIQFFTGSCPVLVTGFTKKYVISWVVCVHHTFFPI